MRRPQITFLVAGLFAGLICVVLGSLETPEIAIVALTYGVGLLFFAAIIAGIVLTGAWRYVKGGFLRYFASLVLSFITYMVGLIAFFSVTGFSSDLFGFRPSANIVNFGIDVWLGLIAAALVGATGIAIVSALLTGEWSNALLWRFMLAGSVTILVTFVINLPFQTYWSFFGILLPLGNALFCSILGAHIWLRANPTSERPATA
jgi:hypothetical protein